MAILVANGESHEAECYVDVRNIIKKLYRVVFFNFYRGNVWQDDFTVHKFIFE